MDSIAAELRVQHQMTTELLGLEKFHAAAIASQLSMLRLSMADYEAPLRITYNNDHSTSNGSRHEQSSHHNSPPEASPRLSSSTIRDIVSHMFDERPTTITNASRENSKERYLSSRGANFPISENEVVNTLAHQRLANDEHEHRLQIEMEEMEICCVLDGYNCRVRVSSDILQHQLLSLLDHVHYVREALLMHHANFLESLRVDLQRKRTPPSPSRGNSPSSNQKPLRVTRLL